MKDFFKILLILLAASSAFWIGFYMGGEEVKNKFPDFQEESEEDNLD